jgi:hypothetical protein
MLSFFTNFLLTLSHTVQILSALLCCFCYTHFSISILFLTIKTIKDFLRFQSYNSLCPVTRTTLRETGSSSTDTVTLAHTSGFDGRLEIFSAISISSGRTKPKTVYDLFHSWWSARLTKNSGPCPTHATEPRFILGQASLGISLKTIPSASNVP